MAGRADERRLAARALRSGRAVIVRGPAGIGKSKFLVDVEESWRAGTVRITGLRGLTHRPFGALEAAGIAMSGDVARRATDLLAELGGRLLVVDGLQWVDAATLEAIAAVAEHAALLAATRADVPDGLDDPLVIDLGPLAVDMAREIVATHAPELPPEIIDDIVGRSDGNPLLLTELTRARLPTLRAVAEAALADASAGLRRALAMLAVAGQPIPLSHLGVVAEELEATRITAAGDRGIELRHGMLERALVGVLTPEELTAAHARLVDVLRDEGSAARHLQAAGDSEGAVRLARRAAISATTPLERATYLDFAVRAAPGASTRELALDAAAAWLDVRRHDAAVCLVEEHPALFTAGARCWVLAGRAWSAGAYGEVEELVESGLASLAEREERVAAGLELFAARVALETRYDAASALIHAEAARRHAEAAGQSTAAMHAVIARSQMLAGQDGWEPELRVAAVAAESKGDLAGAAQLRRALFGALVFFGRPAEAEIVMAELEAFSEGCGRHADVISARAVRASLALLLHGDAAGAERACRALEGEPFSSRAGVHLTALRGIALADLRRLPEAVALLEREISRQRSPAARAAAHGALAEVHLASGRPDLAESHAAAAIELGAPTAPMTPAAMAALAWAQLGQGRVVEPSAGEAPYPAVAGAYREVAAIAAWSSGDAVTAAAYFDEAADLWSTAFRRAEWRCRWGAAAALADAGDHALAIERLETLATTRNLPGWISDLVRQSLRQLGAGRRPPRTAEGASTVSGRERQVLDLVADGWSTNDIASHLHLAPTTVDSMARSASRRLGARSRVHAAVLAIGNAALWAAAVFFCGDADLDSYRDIVREAGSEIVPLGHGGPGQTAVGVADGPNDIAAIIASARSGSNSLIAATGSTARVLASDLASYGLRVVRLDDEDHRPLGAILALKPEESALLSLLASGRTRAEAAAILKLSPRTVARRLAEAKQTLGVRSTAEAIRVAGAVVS